MEIVTLKQAREQGLTRYFTGKPCKHGHVSERFTKCRSCCECKAEKNHLPQNKEARKRYAGQHPDQMLKYGRDWYHRGGKDLKAKYKKENADKQKQYEADWKERDPEASKERSRRYYQNHTEKVKAQKKQYAKDHPHIYAAAAAKRRAALLQRTPPWLTAEDHLKIQAIYDEAHRLESLDGVKRHVDHIIPLQGEEVSGLHVPENLQILTESENCSKWNRT